MFEEPKTRPADLDSRVLISAPVGNDAAVTALLLREAGMVPCVCADPEMMQREMQRGCAVLILAEEILGGRAILHLTGQLEAQPSWSDIPILIITGRGEPTELAQRKISLFGSSGNVSLLERPFRPLTMINAAKVAISSRQRQYQVRDLLLERERILADLERNVEMRTAELRDTNGQLEEFVYSIAHDLRAPLRAMQGFSSLLVDTYGELLPPEGKNFAERILRSAEAMDAITLDLLAYGRMARSEVSLGPVAVEAVWEAAVFQCEKAIEETGAQVEAAVPLPLLQAHAPILTQVLANLLSNALKFAREGEMPRVLLRAEEIDDTTVRLWVEDNGIGIAPQYQQRIFRVFERLNGAKYQGTGIGLSIVRKGVERMGGTIGLESEVGSGSRFWIQLPKAT